MGVEEQSSHPLRPVKRTTLAPLVLPRLLAREFAGANSQGTVIIIPSRRI